MKQINVRVPDKVGQAFYKFCERQEITPYELLSAIVGFYGRAELIAEKTISKEEALVELGKVISDIQKFARANGEFLRGVAAVLEPYGVRLSDLWPRIEGPRQAVQP